MVVDLNLREMQ